MITIKWEANATQRVMLHEKFDLNFSWKGEIPYDATTPEIREKHHALARIYGISVKLTGEWDSEPKMEDVEAQIEQHWREYQEALEAEAARKREALKLVSENEFGVFFRVSTDGDVVTIYGKEKELGLLDAAEKPKINDRRINDDPSIFTIIKKFAEDGDEKAKDVLAEFEHQKREAKIRRDAEKAKSQAEQEERQREWKAREAAEAQELDRMLRLVLAARPIILQQYNDGLLLESDQRDILREYFWGSLDENLEKYTKLRGADIEHNEECSGYGDIEFEVDDATGLTTDEYATLQRIRELFPQQDNNWEVEARTHKGQCEECEAYVLRGSALVSKKVGPYTLSREYNL